MPVKRFWFYNRQVDRLAAEEDLRTLYLLGSATSQETFTKQREGLEAQMGQIWVIGPETTQYVVEETEDGLDPEFDREGLMALKARM